MGKAMSWGICICSVCKHEAHQTGEIIRKDRGWTHCDTNSPICDGANAMYLQSKNEITGKWCGRDGFPNFLDSE